MLLKNNKLACVYEYQMERYPATKSSRGNDL